MIMTIFFDHPAHVVITSYYSKFGFDCIVKAILKPMALYNLNC